MSVEDDFVLDVSVLFLRFKCRFNWKASTPLKGTLCCLWGLWLSSFYWYVQYSLSLSCSPTPSVSTTALCSIWQFFSGGSPRIRILGVLPAMHEYIHSWVHTRPKDLTDPLSPLILRRLNYYGDKHCICVFSDFSHAGWPLGYIVQKTNRYLPFEVCCSHLSAKRETKPHCHD